MATLILCLQLAGLAALLVVFVKLERALRRERRLHVKYETLYDSEARRNDELLGQIAELAAMNKREVC
jgi:hypothetical protein